MWFSVKLARALLLVVGNQTAEFLLCGFVEFFYEGGWESEGCRLPGWQDVKSPLAFLEVVVRTLSRLSSRQRSIALGQSTFLRSPLVRSGVFDSNWCGMDWNHSRGKVDRYSESTRRIDIPKRSGARLKSYHSILFSPVVPPCWTWSGLSQRAFLGMVEIRRF